MPRSREPPPTRSAAIGANPVFARHAASVWRMSRANGWQLGDRDLVDPRPRLAGRRLGLRRDEAVGVLRALGVGHVSFQWRRDRLGDVLAGARDAAAEHRLAGGDHDDVGALVADVDDGDRAVGARLRQRRRALDEPDRRATAREHAARARTRSLAELDQLLGAVAAHRVRQHAHALGRAARRGRADPRVGIERPARVHGMARTL